MRERKGSNCGRGAGVRGREDSASVRSGSLWRGSGRHSRKGGSVVLAVGPEHTEAIGRLRGGAIQIKWWEQDSPFGLENRVPGTARKTWTCLGRQAGAFSHFIV